MNPPPTPYTELVQLIEDLPVAVREKRRRLGLSLRTAGQEAGVGANTIARIEARKRVVTHHTVAVINWLGQP